MSPVSEFRHDPPWAADYPDVQPPRGLHVRQTGKLPEVVTRYGNWGDRQILICGGPEMVAATKEALIAKGAPAERIQHDPLQLKSPPRQIEHRRSTGGVRMAKMRAARMYGYKQPLTLEEIPIPDIEPTEVLVKVGGAGMCRTDFQLIDGYFHSNLPMEFPATPGHEIAGTIARIGSAVPAAAGLSRGRSGRRLRSARRIPGVRPACRRRFG